MGETERLWQQYIDGRSADVRRTLIESYAPLARYVVDRMNLRPGAALEYDDLLSQAVVGLIDAVDRFDPTRGIKFETYAYYRIRGAVMDMLRELDWLPRSIRQREAQLSRAYAALEDRFGRPPTDAELARELSLTIDQLDTLAQEVALQTMQSLDETVSSHAWDTGTVGDVVADPSAPSPEDELQRQAEREMIARSIEDLPDAERTVVTLYYYEGLTLKEIGQVMGVTESRACQVHGKAMLRLRAGVQALLNPPAEKARILSRGAQPAVNAAKFSSDAAGA
ncbi:MAG TPA: FliA/WhiG family RNA polymerase sigma factor [Armatimonadota bacterium]|nr:FliA/WhiG family RNA polymerase sigma factor [Armatimonadota bacterium]